MPRIAEQGLAGPECSHLHVALGDLGHARAGQLERVVARLVVEDLGDRLDALFGDDLIGDPQFVAQRAGLRDRGNLVDDDGLHDGGAPGACGAASSPARRRKTTVKGTIPGNTTAAARRPSPAHSPHTPPAAPLSEYGDS